MNKYILSIDQSTQGTKVLLVDENGEIVKKVSKSHRQIIDNNGYVSHDFIEIYDNLLELVKNIIIDLDGKIIGISITNQRETAVIWDKKTGLPLDYGIVWQCERAKTITDNIKISNEVVKYKTGLNLSPYFSAAKFKWLLDKYDKRDICLGTVDSYLIFRLTKGIFKTDYSNASRTQLFNIRDLKWDEELLDAFGIKLEYLPEVCASDSLFGYTNFEGVLSYEVPIIGVLGDSQSALYAEGCLEVGTGKITYGTGSSIVVNIGDKIIDSRFGLSTSIGYKVNDKLNYILEGNITDSGSIISWLKNSLMLISSPDESEKCANLAKLSDNTILIPAFSGLGAPYWNNNISASFKGMTRLTGKNELVRAGLESICFQIADVISAMKQELEVENIKLSADGGATTNKFLMQYQADVIKNDIYVSTIEELSALGVAFIALEKLTFLKENVIKKIPFYFQNNNNAQRKYELWHKYISEELKYEIY